MPCATPGAIRSKHVRCVGNLECARVEFCRSAPARGSRFHKKEPALARRLWGTAWIGRLPAEADTRADRALAVAHRTADGERGLRRDLALVADRQRRLAIAVAVTDADAVVAVNA